MSIIVEFIYQYSSIIVEKYVYVYFNIHIYI